MKHMIPVTKLILRVDALSTKEEETPKMCMKLNNITFPRTS